MPYVLRVIQKSVLRTLDIYGAARCDTSQSL